MKRVLILICSILQMQILAAGEYVSENFSFQTNDGLTLNGTLTIPENFKYDSASQLLIMVPTPESTNRDAEGLYSSFADILSGQGIAVLRFDSRIADTSLFRFDGRIIADTSLKISIMTIEIQANDAFAAFCAMKQEDRFSKCRIGLVGYAASGCSAAILASEHHDISPLVLLTTLGINGSDFVYADVKHSMDLIPVFPQKDKTMILQFFREQLNVIEKYHDEDSLNFHLKNLFKDKFDNADTESKKILFGSQTFEQICENDIKQYSLPYMTSFLRFNPEKYYSKITCPVLIVHGKWDVVTDYKKNTTGLKKIFDKNKKTNYSIMLIDSLDHYYRHPEIKPEKDMGVLSRPKAIKEKMAGKEIVTEVWEMIAKWINTPEGEEKYNKAVLGKTINSKHLKIYALMVIAGVLVIILLNRWAIKRNK